jgi:hypothetical protein
MGFLGQIGRLHRRNLGVTVRVEVGFVVVEIFSL